MREHRRRGKKSGDQPATEQDRLIAAQAEEVCRAQNAPGDDDRSLPVFCGKADGIKGRQDPGTTITRGDQIAGTKIAQTGFPTRHRNHSFGINATGQEGTRDRNLAGFNPFHRTTF